MKKICSKAKRLIIKIVLIIAVASVFFAEKANAQQYYPDVFDMTKADTKQGQSVIEKAEDIFKNGIDISPQSVLKKGTEIFFSSVRKQLEDMKKMMALIIICALLKSLSSSFAGKEVSQLGFLVCCVVMIYIVLSAFYEQCNEVKKTVESFAKINAVMLPAFLTISAAQGKIASGTLSSSVIIGLSGAASAFLRMAFIPFLTAAAGLEMVNAISENSFFSSMCALIKSLLTFSLKGIGLAFVFTASLWRLSASGADTLMFKTARTAVKCVPVVGEILSSSAETITAAAAAAGNSFTAAAFIAAIGICAVPVLRLAAVFLIYRITAAITEPVSDKRITKALEGAGDFFVILIGTVFLSAMMFIFSAVILMAVF